MSYEIPKPNIKQDTQVHMDFDTAAIEYALKQKEQALDAINKKYQYAKVPIHIVEGDVKNGYTVKGETLEEYADGQNLIYAPASNDDEERRENIYHTK